MIKYIGNFADWIKPEWLNEVMSKPGFDMPKHSLRNEARFNPILFKYLNNGDVTRVHSKDEYLQIVEDLKLMDSNDPVVKHARMRVDFIDPDFELDEEYNMYTNAGYDVFGTHFRLLEKFDVSFDILKDPPPFLDYKDKHITWWFSKMNPGDIMPMHVDRAKPEIEIHKYWMPWTPYEPGHVFVIENEEITNYKVGDVFEFDYAGSWHGAFNIGSTPRCILQITDYKVSRDINACN
jgi:hypothetical protein